MFRRIERALVFPPAAYIWTDTISPKCCVIHQDLNPHRFEVPPPSGEPEPSSDELALLTKILKPIPQKKCTHYAKPIREEADNCEAAIDVPLSGGSHQTDERPPANSTRTPLGRRGHGKSPAPPLAAGLRCEVECVEYSWVVTNSPTMRTIHMASM